MTATTLDAFSSPAAPHRRNRFVLFSLPLYGPFMVNFGRRVVTYAHSCRPHFTQVTGSPKSRVDSGRWLAQGSAFLKTARPRQMAVKAGLTEKPAIASCKCVSSRKRRKTIRRGKQG